MLEAEELGLITHVPYRGVRLTEAGGESRSGDPPPPTARELPRGRTGDALGPGARRGRGAGARALRGPRGADRGQVGHPTVDPHGGPIPSGRSTAGAETPLESLEPGARAVRARVGLRPRDAALPRRSAGSRPAELRGRDRQPFGGPLFVRFGDASTCIGGGLAAGCVSGWRDAADEGHGCRHRARDRERDRGQQPASPLLRSAPDRGGRSALGRPSRVHTRARHDKRWHCCGCWSGPGSSRCSARTTVRA